jgi:hypothetical protein
MANGNGLKLLDCEREFTPLVASTTIKLSATVYEVGGTGPTNIIRTDQDWYVDVEWEITGHLIHHLCGTWHVSVVLESIGPGNEYQFPDPPDKVKMDPCGDGTFKHRINVRAGEVEARDVDGTLYIIGVTLGSTDACDKPGHVYAYCTGEELHFVPGPVHVGP